MEKHKQLPTGDAAIGPSLTRWPVGVVQLGEPEVLGHGGQSRGRAVLQINDLAFEGFTSAGGKLFLGGYFDE